VFDHLGLTDTPVGEPPLQRMRDEINAQWAARLGTALET
jgi:hypothetical protein